MISEYLRNEAWRKKLEQGGFRVIEEKVKDKSSSSSSDADITAEMAPLVECNNCGSMYESTGICSCCP
jgi:ribosomal protein L32